MPAQRFLYLREELQQEVMAIMGQVRVLEEECAKMQAMAQEGQGVC